MDAITQAREDAKIALGAQYDFFFLRYRNAGQLGADQELIYEEAFNAAVQEIEDSRWKPASEIDRVMDRAALMQELEADKEKYKDAEMHLREPMERLIRVVMWHLANRGYHGFFIDERRDGKVILSDRGNMRFFAPEWLADLYKKAVEQLITVGRSYKVGEIVEYKGRTYRVVETDYISAAEAANLEDGWDVFDAEGPYSKLELIEEEEKTMQHDIPRPNWASYEQFPHRILFDVQYEAERLGFIINKHSSDESPYADSEDWNRFTIHCAFNIVDIRQTFKRPVQGDRGKGFDEAIQWMRNLPSKEARQCILDIVKRGEATIVQENGTRIVKFSAEGNEIVPLHSLEYSSELGLYDKRQFPHGDKDGRR